MAAESRRLLCISLHDVAPATLEDCANALEFLDELRLGPVALLVVPDYHGLGRADRDLRFARFIDARVRRGDEVVLHGFRHADGAPHGTGPWDWLERRIYTAGEGEFSRLDIDTARMRILRGLAVLRSAGWQTDGFVAPAWLMSEGTIEALEELPLKYFSARDSVTMLASGQKVHAPSLVVSTRAAWRRGLSHVWNHARLRRHERSPILRAAIHPGDLGYTRIELLWRRLLTSLGDRAIVTEGQLRPPATRP
ncbi:MAG: polysaccharide deacetylase family protein [Steroidobacteraceae bacterium]